VHTKEAWAKDREQRAKRLEGIRRGLLQGKEKGPRWYVNGQGQTMVVVPGPVEFVMGSPPTEVGRRPDEEQHRRRIGRTFAIAARSVTKEQFLRFLPQYIARDMMTSRYRDPDLPIGAMTWYQAAAYCNWLSAQEGIPAGQWCYEADRQGRVVRMRANYLSLTGYRLPTEAEWEYACRAGARTSRYYGESDELLTEYAWYARKDMEHLWPVDRKKPNDLGLFDMLGNISTWCQERYQGYPTGRAGEAVEDREDDLLDVRSSDNRVLRGGWFYYLASSVRSARRVWNVATYHGDNSFGLRPARTFR
jgi:formylglycine-generating enzyme required for sulfatase activity